ncbi:MAG TPA: TolC family protein, partial [Candidatus Eremiobacteraeota bacterium]|nr:TolC family protein [Candidatus Eremiobacteraeota bacterium]
MKRIFLLFLILILNLNCSAREVNPKKITLEESIKITLQNSLDLRSTEQDIYKSEVRISQAKTGGYPSFSGSMYYTRIDPVQEISVGDRKTPLGQNNQSQGKVTFNYNLYDGGRVTNLVDATTLLSQATFCELEITRQNVLYKAISSYYDVLKSKKLLRVAENTLTTTIEQYNISRDFYEEGLVAMADVLSANAQVANTELGLIKAQNGVELAKSALNDTMGLSLTAEYDLVDNLVYKPYTVDLDYTTELAYNNRAEGKKIMYLIGAAEKQIDVAKSDRLPTVNFNFDYILFSSSLFNASNSVNATFSASIPIFDRGLTICKIDEAEANLEQAKINLEQIK